MICIIVSENKLQMSKGQFSLFYNTFYVTIIRYHLEIIFRARELINKNFQSVFFEHLTFGIFDSIFGSNLASVMLAGWPWWYHSVKTYVQIT